jgi:pyocin large subunit-like protein
LNLWGNEIMRLIGFPIIATALLATGALFLTACDGGATAVPASKAGERRASAEATDTPASSGTSSSRRDDPRDAPVRLIAGKPFWAANRTRTAEENAERAFERNGEAFGAVTVDDYVEAAHRFVADPPKGVETLKRANGDTLIYDPGGNVFAVVSREGAPRALFKPDDGAAYWEVQKTRESRRATAARERGQADSG